MNQWKQNTNFLLKKVINFQPGLQNVNLDAIQKTHNPHSNLNFMVSSVLAVVEIHLKVVYKWWRGEALSDLSILSPGNSIETHTQYFICVCFTVADFQYIFIYKIRRRKKEREMPGRRSLLYSESSSSCDA